MLCIAAKHPANDKTPHASGSSLRQHHQHQHHHTTHHTTHAGRSHTHHKKPAPGLPRTSLPGSVQGEAATTTNDASGTETALYRSEDNRSSSDLEGPLSPNVPPAARVSAAAAAAPQAQVTLPEQAATAQDPASALQAMMAALQAQASGVNPFLLQQAYGSAAAKATDLLSAFQQPRVAAAPALQQQQQQQQAAAAMVAMHAGYMPPVSAAPAVAGISGYGGQQHYGGLASLCNSYAAQMAAVGAVRHQQHGHVSPTGTSSLGHVAGGAAAGPAAGRAHNRLDAEAAEAVAAIGQLQMLQRQQQAQAQQQPGEQKGPGLLRPAPRRLYSDNVADGQLTSAVQRALYPH